MPKEAVEPVGGIWQVKLGFEAAGERADRLQADHLCGLELGVWVASVQAQLDVLEFCLFIVQCLFIAAGGRYWIDPGN